MDQVLRRAGVSVLVSAIAIAGCAAEPDYAQESSWLERPAVTDKPVDVFYVYPTIYGDAFPANMDTNSPDMRRRARGAMVSQASAYTKTANLFAPLYRQMSMAYLRDDTDMYRDSHFQVGAQDVIRAFDYYIEHLNGGRPFLLAGHSQGSMALICLMRERLADPALQKKLVAAYLIGYSVTRDDLERYPWMRPAEREDDTGVIVSWNTQAPDATGSPVLLPGAICINPLTWRTDAEPADKALNLGAVFYDDRTQEVARIVPHYVGARIDPATGALTASPPEELDVGSFPQGVYHKFDYAFWYRNLQRNVAVRVDRMLDPR